MKAYKDTVVGNPSSTRSISKPSLCTTPASVAGGPDPAKLLQPINPFGWGHINGRPSSGMFKLYLSSACKLKPIFKIGMYYVAEKSSELKHNGLRLTYVLCKSVWEGEKMVTYICDLRRRKLFDEFYAASMTPVQIGDRLSFTRISEVYFWLLPNHSPFCNRATASCAKVLRS